MQSFRILAVIFCLVASGLAQDPLKVAPQAYKLEFENDWVKVVRVRYGPREKIPAHEHTKMAAAYVYLNDSGPVVFKHIGLDYGAITRQPTKAGSFRVYRAVREIHEVENLSDLPSEFLRVEWKTEPAGEKSLHGRFFRESYPAGENYQKVQFENEQVRITRLVAARGKKLDISTSATEPALLVVLTAARFKVTGPKVESSSLNLEPGKTMWVTVDQKEQLENVGGAPTELLRFDFKTKPVA